MLYPPYHARSDQWFFTPLFFRFISIYKEKISGTNGYLPLYNWGDFYRNHFVFPRNFILLWQRDVPLLLFNLIYRECYTGAWHIFSFTAALFKTYKKKNSNLLLLTGV